MKKKYFTEEEKKAARKLEAKKYYEKIKKPPLSEEEKGEHTKKRIKKRETYIKGYYIDNKEKICQYSKEYFKLNKITKQKKNNDRYKQRRNEDPVFKLITNLKRNIRAAIKKGGLVKNSSTQMILGCDLEKFKNHIEYQFEPWMNWNNYGLYNGQPNYGWDIDHIVPLSTATTVVDVERLNHFTNLQPLCGYINRVIKRDKVLTVSKNDNISSLVIK